MSETDKKIFKFWIEDEILYSRFLEPIHLDTTLGQQLIDERHIASDFKKQYWCYDFTNVLSMSKECREHAALAGQDYLYASAAIVNSRVQAFIINIFISLKNPKIPFKAFTQKEDAVEWLNSIKQKNEMNEERIG
jgi:hypothetical protein